MRILFRLAISFLFITTIHADDNNDYTAELNKKFNVEQRRTSELFRGRVNLLLHLRTLAPDIWNPEIVSMFDKWTEGYGEKRLKENAKLLTKIKYVIEGSPRLHTDADKRRRLNEGQEWLSTLQINNNGDISDMEFLVKQLPCASRLKEILAWQEVVSPEHADPKLKKLEQVETELRNFMMGDLGLLALLLEHVPVGHEHESHVFQSRVNTVNAVERCYASFQKAQMAARKILGRLLVTSPLTDEAAKKALNELVAASLAANQEIESITGQAVLQIKFAPELETWFQAAGLRK